VLADAKRHAHPFYRRRAHILDFSLRDEFIDLVGGR
jgi:hypothetical protein